VSSLSIATLIASVVSYLICGIPFGLLFASRMNGVDVRKTGSGNIGMTNVARSAGGAAAALTFICDVGKGALCVLVAKWVIAQVCLGGDQSMLAYNSPFGWVGSTLYLACVLGHIFSPYLHFHGGKGISVGLGAALGMWWPIGVGLLALFLLLVIPTGYISLGSVAAAASLPIQAALWGMSPTAIFPVAIVAVVVIWSHRENIGRLMRGEERKFSVRSKGKK
jgi:glycerol-3-phosphate acyltransferase PlsY